MKKTKSILKSVLALFVALSVLAAVSCSEPPTPKKKKKPEVKSVVVTTDGSLTFKKGDTMKSPKLLAIKDMITICNNEIDKLNSMLHIRKISGNQIRG